MAYVWRVEDENCYGPYRHVLAAIEAHKAMGGGGTFSTDRHPTPNNDPILRDWARKFYIGEGETIGGWRFGFASLDQFRRWFNTKDARQVLDNYGFRLRKYWVPSEALVKGASQVVFKSQKALRMEERRTIYADQ